MKVLLVVSPNFSIKMLKEEIDNLKRGDCDFTKSVDWRPAAPIGILYLAGSLRSTGYDVEIYDFHRAFYICREQGYFKENDLSDFFEDYFENILKNKKIDVLGISSLFNVSSSTVEEMGKICRRVLPSAKIITGGHYPTNMYREILKKGICDYIILGEAEKELVWLLDHIKNPDIEQKINDHPHIVGLKCIDNADKKPAFISNLDSLPMPAWDLLPQVEEYIGNSIDAERIGSSTKKDAVRSASIFTTRGCPMRCTFCAAHKTHGRTIRVHSIDYIMDHIDWLVDNYNINNLLIQDDMFNFSSKRTIEFCKRLFEKYRDRFDLEFPNGLAIWKLDEESIINLKKVGMRSCTIAIESGNKYVQKHILKKNLNLNLVKKKIELLKKHDIKTRAFFIVGFVGETIEMMNDTIEFAIDLNMDWSEVKVLTPLVGSEMYEIAKEKNYLVGDMSEHVYGRASVMTPDFNPEQVKDIQYGANIRINFLNNRCLTEKKYENAELIFRGLLRNFPNHLFAQWGLWEALKGQKKIKEAAKALKKLREMTDESEKNRVLLEKYDIHAK